MTISTTARLRAFCIIACFGGSALTGCQASASETAADNSGNGTPVTSADPTDPSGSTNPYGATTDSGTAAQNPSDDASAPQPPTAENPETPTSPETPTNPAPPASYPPSAPITVRKNEVVTLKSSASSYFVVVPDSYDATHNTASSLFIWLHGCGGDAANDARVVSPGGSQSWVTVSVGGRDGGCWSMGSDGKMVLAALDDVKTRLNIDPHRVVIGGYSSGGNLAYRTAFFNADRFAGVIAENTAAFYGTESSQSASLAAAAWKFNVVHLAHVGDTTFKIATVRSETDALKAAGFPVTLLERDGTHYDSNTNPDLRTYLLPFLDAGWRSPD